jgi:hypothetical protein
MIHALIPAALATVESVISGDWVLFYISVEQKEIFY